MSKIVVNDFTGAVTGVSPDGSMLEGLQSVTLRKFARQGHAIPNSNRGFSGPFPPELLENPKVEYPDMHTDSLHPALDNTRMFICRECQTVLEGTELELHDCADFLWSSPSRL